MHFPFCSLAIQSTCQGLVMLFVKALVDSAEVLYGQPRPVTWWEVDHRGSEFQQDNPSLSSREYAAGNDGWQRV